MMKISTTMSIASALRRPGIAPGRRGPQVQHWVPGRRTRHGRNRRSPSAIILVGGSGTVPDDEPPLITPDSTPIRVRAGQSRRDGYSRIKDRQIFEGAARVETRVVDREEQPVDLGEGGASDAVARWLPRHPAAAQNRAGRVIRSPQVNCRLISTATANAFESRRFPPPPLPELGEPRAVFSDRGRLRPDGSIIRNNGESRSAAPAASTSRKTIRRRWSPSAPWSVDPSGRPVSGQPEPGQSASDQSASPAETEPDQAGGERAGSTAGERARGDSEYRSGGDRPARGAVCADPSGAVATTCSDGPDGRDADRPAGPETNPASQQTASAFCQPIDPGPGNRGQLRSPARHQQQ